MDMYNMDGSRGRMCGNGIRCFAKYVYDYGLTDKEELKIETLSGIKTLKLTVKDGKVSMVTVDMGSPIFEPDKIPVKSDKDRVINSRRIGAGRTKLPACPWEIPMPWFCR